MVVGMSNIARAEIEIDSAIVKTPAKQYCCLVPSAKLSLLSLTGTTGSSLWAYICCHCPRLDIEIQGWELLIFAFNASHHR